MSATDTTALAPRTLADQLAERGVTPAQYLVLTKSLYPGAKPESALMVLDYCAARKLDPMKKPCHIVPMKVKVNDEWIWRDVVLPGIYEYRTTAMRTGLYLGHTAPAYGEMKDYGGVSAPEWCSMTFKRAGANGVVIEFPVTVYFREVCNTKHDGSANERWKKAPIQMLTKCAEAAGLREAFPDEFGGEQTVEEMEGREPLDVPPAAPIKPATRVSQQAAVGDSVVVETPKAADPEPVKATVAPAATTPATPTNVGMLEAPIDKSQNGKFAALILLNTGFRCSTRDEALFQAVVALRDKNALVELLTKPSSDPSRFAPVLEEVVVINSGEIVE